MRKFLFKTVLFCLPLLGLLFVLSWNDHTEEGNHSSDYMASIIDKHKRLNSISSPKIILAGGSNAAFGINSGAIEDTFSMPVVNLSLHAGLGLSFILQELKHSIHEHDIVILSVEYFLEPGGNYRLKKYVRDLYAPAHMYYTSDIHTDLTVWLEDRQELFKNLINPSGSRKPQVHPVYNRYAFNQFGDMTGHLNMEKSPDLHDRVQLTYRYWEGIDALNEFCVYASQKEVSVYFLYPCYPESEYETNRIVINHLAEDVTKSIQCKMINTPQDFVYPDSLFFDTVYHLNREGRTYRTEKLIELMKRHWQR